MKTTFIIKNGNTGLTSDDVFNCTDLLQLQQWEMEQQIDVTSMRVQLEKANQYTKGSMKTKNITTGLRRHSYCKRTCTA